MRVFWLFLARSSLPQWVHVMIVVVFRVFVSERFYDTSPFYISRIISLPFFLLGVEKAWETKLTFNIC